MLSNLPRNPGMTLNLDWFERVRISPNAVERRAGTFAARRSVKKEYQAAWHGATQTRTVWILYGK